MARPPLPRYRAELTLAIDLGAEDLDHATERLEAIAIDAAERIRATIRATRIGAPVVDAVILGDVTARKAPHA